LSSTIARGGKRGTLPLGNLRAIPLPWVVLPSRATMTTGLLLTAATVCAQSSKLRMRSTALRSSLVEERAELAALRADLAQERCRGAALCAESTERRALLAVALFPLLKHEGEPVEGG